MDIETIEIHPDRTIVFLAHNLGATVQELGQRRLLITQLEEELENTKRLLELTQKRVEACEPMADRFSAFSDHMEHMPESLEALCCNAIQGDGLWLRKLMDIAEGKTDA